jgi:hypothetical protein
MNRTDIAILVNTTPKYFGLLDSFIGLIRRYGPTCRWPIFLATEKHESPVILGLGKQYGINIICLDDANADFLESRYSSVRSLPPSIRYILPLQDDFLLERPGLNVQALEEALNLLDTDHTIESIRLMPCPGAKKNTPYKTSKQWMVLSDSDLTFSYQATIWRRELYSNYLFQLAEGILEENPTLKRGTAAYNQHCIRVNPAETTLGLLLLKTLSPQGLHLCWLRHAAWANAVYWCPWPYRPTAVVQGVLEPWAQELIRREGFVVPTFDALKRV